LQFIKNEADINSFHRRNEIANRNPIEKGDFESESTGSPQRILKIEYQAEQRK
jgi:hypothetical protein